MQVERFTVLRETTIRYYFVAWIRQPADKTQRKQIQRDRLHMQSLPGTHKQKYPIAGSEAVLTLNAQQIFKQAIKLVW